MMSGCKKNLVMLLAGAGDTLLTTPMLKELKQLYPEAELDVLVMQGPSACQVLEGNPNIDRIHFHNFMKTPIASSIMFCLELRKVKYDNVIVPMPHNRFVYNMIAMLIGGRRRIGFSYHIKCGTVPSLFFSKTIKENTSIHLVDNNLRVITEGFGSELKAEKHKLDLFLTDENISFADEYIKRNNLGGRVLLGIHPGSGTTKNLVLKRWAPEKWAELARVMAEKYKARILVLGGREEQQLKDKVVSLSGLSSDMIYDVDGGTVKDVAALISRCDCIISGDTLVPHVSAAVGTPVAVIYGPTSHVAAYPYGVQYELAWTGIACSPCYGFSRYGIKCTNKDFMKCLNDVTVDMVMDAVAELVCEEKGLCI